MSLDYEARYRDLGYQAIAGCDEAGRGPLAGPVVAAAVIFPDDYHNDAIDDSKKLTDQKRRALFTEIKAHARAFGIAIVSPATIDRINIYQASRLAMTEALSQLSVPYDMVITDYMPLPDEKVPVDALVKGDGKAQCVAAASILAKVTRDDLMIALDRQYPQYGFARHKGYPTPSHLEAIAAYGLIPGLYRESYGPVREILDRDLRLFR